MFWVCLFFLNHSWKGPFCSKCCVDQPSPWENSPTVLRMQYQSLGFSKGYHLSKLKAFVFNLLFCQKSGEGWMLQKHWPMAVGAHKFFLNYLFWFCSKLAYSSAWLPASSNPYILVWWLGYSPSLLFNSQPDWWQKWKDKDVIRQALGGSFLPGRWEPSLWGFISVLWAQKLGMISRTRGGILCCRMGLCPQSLIKAQVSFQQWCNV